MVIGRIETVFYRKQDLVEELFHQRRIGPCRFVVASCVELVDEVDGGDRCALDSRLVGRYQHVDAVT